MINSIDAICNCLSLLLRQNKAKSSICRMAASGDKPNIDMTAMLKDMKKIQLRQIAR